MNIERLRGYLLSNVCRAPEGDGGGGGGDTNTNTNTGGGGETWYSSMGLDAETTNYIAERKFPDVKAALASGRESGRLANSRNVFERPTPGKEAEWSGWKELGWTPEPEKYQLKAPDDNRKKELGFEYDQDLWGKVRESAHKNRIPLSQAQALHDDILEYTKTRVGEARARGAKSSQDLQAELQGEWGADFPRKKEIAKRAAQVLGVGMDDQSQLEKVVGAPALLKMFAKIGDMLGEDKLITTNSSTGNIPTSVEGVRAAMNAFKNDQVKKTALNDPLHGQHENVKAEWSQLTGRLADAEKQAAGARR